MKNKMVLNITVAYFVMLSVILLVQISEKEIQAIEPLPSELTIEDKLKSSVVLALDSPVTIINEKQFIIDENDSTITPIINNGKIYIPVILLETAFNANVNYSVANQDVTVRLDNKALIFSSETNLISVIDNISAEEIQIEAEPKVINDMFYIPLRSFANIFDKEIFYADELIIITNIQDIFDPIEEVDTIEKLNMQVQKLPIVGNAENLKNLITNFNSSDLTDDKSNSNIINKQNLFFDNINLENTENLEELQVIQEPQEVKRVIINKSDNYNFYATNDFIEVYNVDIQNIENPETFSFQIEKINNGIENILISDNNLIVSYNFETYEYLDYDNYKSLSNNNIKPQNITSTHIYNISDTNNIKKIKMIENNGNFYTNILDDDNFYTISKIDLSHDINTLPISTEYIYQNNINVSVKSNEFELNEISYFPDKNDNSYTIVTYLDLLNTEKLYTDVYFGMGNKIEVYNNNLYIATSNTDTQKSNIYLFEMAFNDVLTSNKISVFDNIKSIEFDRSKKMLKVISDGDIKYIDENLISIK